MKSFVVVIGVALLALGVIALVWGFIPTGTEQASVQLGPVEIEAEQQQRLQLPQTLGIVSLIAGAIVLGAAVLRRG